MDKRMEKPKPIKSISQPQPQGDERTKPKLNNAKIRVQQSEKATVSTRNHRSFNEFTSKLISQSTLVSEQSSIVHAGEDSSQSSVIEIDQLCVNGCIGNLKQIDEVAKKKYGVVHGFMFDVEDYRVYFAGRHQIVFKNGYPVCLFVPPAFKSAPDPQTHKIQVLIQRKTRGDDPSPLQYPFIILAPTLSLYPTYISTWIECKRKITLQHYIEYNQQTTQPLSLGNTIHRYLQWLIRSEVEVEEPTQKQIRKLYQQFLYEMYLIGMEFQQFYKKVYFGICHLVNWFKEFVVKGAAIQVNKWEKKYLRIGRVLGSEVMVKSKYFGIRGKVDGLFQGEFHDAKANRKYTVVIPFELKTGKKVQDSHKKQIDLYNLLLRQNKNMPVIGLLYYSQSNTLEYRMQNPLISFQNINRHRNKIIINILNLYANADKIQLPALPNTFEQCKLCDVVEECAVNRLDQNKLRDIEDCVDNTPEKLNPEIMDRLKKMTVLELNYLKKWTLLLHLQECCQRSQNQQNSKKNYYNNLKLPLVQLQKFMQYEIGSSLTLILHKKIESRDMSEQLDNYFKTGQKLRIFMPLIRLADGCRIVGTEKTTKLFKIEVQIKNENIKFNRTKCGFLLQDGQVQHLEVELDRYDNSFYNYTRGYCYKFVNEAEQWLKSIIIDETYQSNDSNKMEKLNDVIQMKNLNEDQISAFQQCCSPSRFCLVEGMPGTGKTQLILKLIQYFYRIGLTVLITSFTNQALSNILDRELSTHKVIPVQHIIREGSKYGITQQYGHLSSQSQDHRSISEYKQYFDSKKVWFVTISSLYIQHLPKQFDVVIVDEASQCLQPNLLEALLKAKKFILIGDEKQLQPVVKSQAAVQKKMQVSLFERLCNLYPNMKSTLKKQYRMSPAIMNLTNNLVYGGKLELATKQMQTRTLQLAVNWQQSTPKYLHQSIQPSKSLRFINYDTALNLLSESDTISMKRVKRLLQIKIACALYKQFRLLGIKRQDILIISAFNSLVYQIVRALKKQQLIDDNHADVMTIDKSQGTDKEVIIFIFHQGNKLLVENYRRLNVALTRAKNKFIIVGSYKELSQLQTWTGKLAKLLQSDQINVDKQFLQALLEENNF